MKVRPLTADQAAKTMIGRMSSRLTGIANVRQIATRLGARPYRCFLVWTSFSGGERGEGIEIEKKRVELLPTPMVQSLDNVALQPAFAGMIKVGDVALSEVHPGYAIADLEGTSFPGAAADDYPEEVSFFYEIVPDGRDGTPDQPRYKFRPMAQPHFDAEELEWRVKLTKISEDRRPGPPDGPNRSTNVGGR
jgi:hypothetical protein